MRNTWDIVKGLGLQSKGLTFLSMFFSAYPDDLSLFASEGIDKEDLKQQGEPYQALEQHC